MSTVDEKKTKAARKPLNDGFHVVQKVVGADTYLVLADSAAKLEDEFSNLYYTTGDSSKMVLKPPYEGRLLANLVSHNNTLSQCIDAMEVNIDGTGYTIEVLDEETTADKAEIKKVNDFCKEPYPGMSLLQIRRILRRQLESVGYAALEVLRNMSGDVLAIRNVDTLNLRLVKLDAPVLVEKSVVREGKEFNLKLWERERRFVQRVGSAYIYHRDFGSSREVNKKTGEWATETTPIKPEDRGTELLFFGINPDTGSPYYTPRWINQLPSILGSRKAEEQNLEYFDAGGLPPAIIFVQGGTLAGTASEQLKTYLSGKNKNKNRAVVVEAQSTSGSLDAAGSVQVKVERFGSEQQKDSMFANYDKETAEHVRGGFRLPALFLGQTAEHNYATAVVAYMVAEEQVFQPEREEFDSIFNKTILKAMGIKTVRYQSKGITLKNIDSQLTALQLAVPMTKGQGVVEEVNKIAGLNLEYQEPQQPVVPDTAIPTDGSMGKPPKGQEGNPPQGKEGKPPQGNVVSMRKPVGASMPGKKTASELVELAMSYGEIRGLLPATQNWDEEGKLAVLATVDQLSEADLSAFNTVIASYAFGCADTDLVALAGCSHAH